MHNNRIIIIILLGLIFSPGAILLDFRQDLTRLVRINNPTLTSQRYGQVELENVGFIVGCKPVELQFRI